MKTNREEHAQVTLLGGGKCKAYCPKCLRELATFSTHEGAMAWATAHMRWSRHLRKE